MSTISPFARPLYVMLKPVGAACNLRCEYCYYLEKSNLYRDAQKRVLSEEMLEQFTKEYIEADNDICINHLRVGYKQKKSHVASTATWLFN